MRSKISKELLESELKILSKEKIAKKYDYTIDSLRNKIRHLGISAPKNYTLKHDYFKHESHAMYYILGVFTADASIHTKRDYITIEVALKDKCLLEFIRDQINKEQKILYYEKYNKKRKKTYKAYKLCFYSKEMKQDLINLGVVPNKTKVGIFVDISQIPDIYFYDFVRGFFDGDGCITRKKSDHIDSGAYKVMKFTSSDKNFLEKLQLRIQLPCNIQQERNHFNLMFHHYSSLQLYDLLYKNFEKSYCLERKREKFNVKP